MASTTALDSDRALVAQECLLTQLYRRVRPRRHSSVQIHFPQTPDLRRRVSLTESPKVADIKSETVLYLAYGSNLSDETFLGNRKIRPLSAVNVLVPELRLTFDLPGVPYLEPCFANTARRDPHNPSLKHSRSASTLEASAPLFGQEYNKDKWKKGLVGTVYEVTKDDYATIIATEGGGASYDDILVDCYPLSLNENEDVPGEPHGQTFKAHTLFAPADPDKEEIKGELGRLRRPDPSYAQASARYLNLITDGARERKLPIEYQNYLSNIRPYTPTTQRQRLGQYVFTTLWVPFIMLFFTLSKMFQDDKGRAPRWVALIAEVLFGGMWLSYDSLFKPLFGDGERTIYKDEDEQTGPLLGEKLAT